MSIKSTKKKGMVLPIVLIVGIVILATSVSLLTLMDNTIRMRKVSEDKIAARYAAEAGIQHGFYQYRIEIDNIEKLNNDLDENNDKSKVEDFIIPIEKCNIKDNLGKILSSYKVEYKASQSQEGIFNIIGICNNAQVKIQVKVDTDTGNIISRIEK